MVKPAIAGGRFGIGIRSVVHRESELNERLGSLIDQMRTEQNLMVKLAENQLELNPVLAKLAESSREGGVGLDEATRTNIRNLDVHLVQVIEDISSGRKQIVEEIRSEIRLLARTIAAMADSDER